METPGRILSASFFAYCLPTWQPWPSSAIKLPRHVKTRRSNASSSLHRLCLTWLPHTYSSIYRDLFVRAFRPRRDSNSMRRLVMRGTVTEHHSRDPPPFSRKLIGPAARQMAKSKPRPTETLVLAWCLVTFVSAARGNNSSAASNRRSNPR